MTPRPRVPRISLRALQGFPDRPGQIRRDRRSGPAHPGPKPWIRAVRDGTQVRPPPSLATLPEPRPDPFPRAARSLGGALSSLFAFEAAASADIPKPVTCVSIASPKVGARSFSRAFKPLERQGKLRHLLVANYQDAVTLAPDMEALSGAYSLLCQDRVFRHVGIELKLYEEDDCRLLYSGKDHGNKVLHVLQKQAMTVASIPSLFMGTDLINNHGCQEYQKRLFRVKEALVTKNLEQLYKDDEICGGIFDKF